MKLPDFAHAKAWLSKLLSEADGSPSTKRVLFTIVIVSVLTFCAIDIGLRHGLTGTTSDLLKCVVAATGGAFGLGRCAEAYENKQ